MGSWSVTNQWVFLTYSLCLNICSLPNDISVIPPDTTGNMYIMHVNNNMQEEPQFEEHPEPIPLLFCFYNEYLQYVGQL